MAIIVQEGLRGLFYAPYYAALARGAYEQEGVEVRFVRAPSPDAAPQALFDGTVDVSWGGPMRVNQLYDQRPDCDLVCFGEAVTRDPFLLVGRTPRSGFALAELMRVRIATVSEVPTRGSACSTICASPGSTPENSTGSPTPRWPTTWRRSGAARSMPCNCSSRSRKS